MAFASSSSSVGMMSRSCVNNVGGRRNLWNSNSNPKGGRRRGVRVRVSSASSSAMVMDPYKTLRIQPGASESEVKKAFRQLALKYHPDVCRGSNSGIQFQTIFEAYDMVMDKLRESEESSEPYYYDDDDDQGIDEPLRGRNDPDYDMWEEWMGWEGAGIRDYSSHINPYI